MPSRRPTIKARYCTTRLFHLFSCPILSRKNSSVSNSVSIHPSCMRIICRFKHFSSSNSQNILSLDSLLLRLDSLRSFSLLQITSSVARGEREGAFGHFGTPWAHGQGEEIVFVLLSGAGRGRDHCRRCRRSCESGFFERLETSGRRRAVVRS